MLMSTRAAVKFAAWQLKRGIGRRKEMLHLSTRS